ncbi:DNA cytosine methyltransferase [Alcaligenaceae bacterium 429]|nr:DNA cytosine methyltransferase [Alcaligenaceae bacterium 429]
MPVHHELGVDLFAGGGGTSTGIEQAIGRPVDIAVNHDPEAIALHEVNHPQTEHLVSDVFEINPLIATRGRPVGLLWASPDCKHFSKAKGGKPVSERIRSLADVVVDWGKAVRPRVIIVENVEEFQAWGPLTDDDKPCPERKGQTFQLWKEQLRLLGYHLEYKELRASDYGTPTIRKRFFMVARCDGLPIVWPEQTHYQKPEKAQKPWVPASSIIDWSIPCPSIFERNRPLVDATCRRVANGVMRHVVKTENPFIVAMVANGKYQTLVSAFLGKHYVGADVGDFKKSHRPVKAGQTHTSEVRSFLVKYYGNDQDGQSLHEPLHTIPTRDRFALVTVHIIDYQIVDIGLRMLSPRELYRAQGFPESYVIDRKPDGSPLTKTAQVRMCGNSVCPPLAHAIVQANYSEQQAMRLQA